MHTPKLILARIPTLLISALVLLTAGVAYAGGTPCNSPSRSRISDPKLGTDPSSACFEIARAEISARDSEIQWIQSKLNSGAWVPQDQASTLKDDFWRDHFSLHAAECEHTMPLRTCQTHASVEAYADRRALDMSTAPELKARLAVLQSPVFSSALKDDPRTLTTVDWPHPKHYEEALAKQWEDHDRAEAKRAAKAGGKGYKPCAPGQKLAANGYSCTTAELIYPGNVGSATQETAANLQDVTGVGPAQSGIAGGE